MKIPVQYIALAIAFGVVVSVGMMALTYKPQPVQVPLNQYQVITPAPTFAPAKVPEPAITTVPVPTSTARFDPAPAPVVVTTEPLPTITAVPAEAPPQSEHAVNCRFREEMAGGTSAFKSLGILMFIAGIIIMVLAMFSSRSVSGIIQGVIMFMLLAVMLVIMPSILDMILLAAPC